MIKHRIIGLVSNVLLSVAYYALAGILVNPLVFWVWLPSYISISQFENSCSKGKSEILPRAYGFLIFSGSFSLYFHLAWFFDWGETATGSSTAAIMFIWIPIYSVAFGYIGYWLGAALNEAKRVRNET